MRDGGQHRFHVAQLQIRLGQLVRLRPQALCMGADPVAESVLDGAEEVDVDEVGEEAFGDGRTFRVLVLPDEGNDVGMGLGGGGAGCVGGKVFEGVLMGCQCCVRAVVARGMSVR